jgi:hypothetical protein
LVVLTRRRRYPARDSVNRVVRIVNGKAKETYTDDPGGTGAEIAIEVVACPACAARCASLDECEPNPDGPSRKTCGTPRQRLS